MPPMTQQQFVQNWQNTTLGERQSYQIHFMELCDLVGHEHPTGSGIDSAGKTFAFEYGLKKDSGGQGFADVFYEGHFAIEYKGAGKYKDLTEAYQQLLQYRERLNNPPLLIVTDIANWEIHTNFPNTEKKVYSFTNADIAHKRPIMKLLQDIFEAPERLHPDRNTAQVTTDAATVFRVIAEDMRRELEASPERIAHFLTKLVFCLFAEDVSLLPTAPNSAKGIFAEIVERTYREPSRFVQYAHELFVAMANGGDVLFQKIPYFNGSLFDDVQVEQVSTEALGKLLDAAALNWESVEPAIFGTLFERSLDPAKRAQLGAHYTSRDDILLIVEPVLMQPLRREWQALQEKAAPVRALFDAAANKRETDKYSRELAALRETMLHRLREIKVLDPACGSGNFLYVSLQLLMDLEKEVITHPLFNGLTLAIPEVHPRQMYGIEINPIAHDLATIVVWIGYIQWRQNNGYAKTFGEPILQDLHDNIRQMDAIMTLSPSLSTERGAGGEVSEPDWPEVDVIVGNPPFLGGNRIRAELGDTYVNALFSLYADRVPAFADLVCYWFEKARAHIAAGKAKRAGLLATNSIRGGVNRQVLQRIKDSGDIFMAWADRSWMLDGAAVRVSMVGFSAPRFPSPRSGYQQSEPVNVADVGLGEGSIAVRDLGEGSPTLDGRPVTTINADLTASSADITTAKHLNVNENISYSGTKKGGAFDITEALAIEMLSATNASGRANSEVVKRWLNGTAIVGEPTENNWIIDFGSNRNEDDVRQYQVPYQYVFNHVYPSRIKNRRATRARYWWLHSEVASGLREAIKYKSRFIATPRVSKHRIFAWYPSSTLPDDGIYIIARDDDYFFGVLHSRLHELWALRMGTSLEDRPRYTPTTTFETFPFPWSPAHEDTTSPAYHAVAAAARQLHAERQAWLDVGGKDRTLTNLYNALNVLKGIETIRVKPDAAAFAPRLLELHTTLDHAVCDAYGWPHDILTNDDEILRRLLALNLQRAAVGEGL